MRIIKSINSGPIAVIAFLVIIFFLITVTFDNPKEKSQKLPPIKLSTNEGRFYELKIELYKDDSFRCAEKVIALTQLAPIITKLIEQYPKGLQLHILASNHASYNAYVQLVAEIKRAYAVLYKEKAMKAFSRPWSELTQLEKENIKQSQPLRMKETVLD